mmetsp:Transcript_19288/g.22304  ORF Transcript_19288/g.22304 Transcript_19288/m.22304 type:complete len:250 (-) Transcript_19288:250-999(-)
MFHIQKSIFYIFLLHSSYYLATDAFSAVGMTHKNILSTSTSASTSSQNIRHFYRHSTKSLYLKSKSDDNNNNTDDGNDENKAPTNNFLSLPPSGGSSFNVEGSAAAELENDNVNQKRILLNDEKSTKVGLVGSAKFELQYTCNVCETRNVNKVSRLAYTKGVVIVVCKGCMAKHLIADNLGWSVDWGINGFDGKKNIEEYLSELGRGDEINRVSKDIFHLEQMLGNGNDGSSNNIEDGDASLEDGGVFE